MEEQKPERKYTNFQAFKRMFALARPELPIILVGTFFLLLGTAAQLAFPQGTQLIVDKALAAKSVDNIDQISIFLGVVFLVMGIAVGIRHYLFTIAGFRVITNLQTTTYRQIIKQEIGFFDQRKTGELLNRLSSDTTVLMNTVSTNISELVRNLTLALGATVLLFITSFKLTILMLSVVPAVSIGAVIFGRMIRDKSKVVQDELAKAGEVAEETISGVRTVRVFAREEQETQRYRSSIVKVFDAIRKRTIYISFFSAGVSFAAFGAIALVMWYGGRLVIAEEMTAGQLFAFIIYTMQVAGATGALGALWTDFMRSVGAAERIFELLDRESEIPLVGGEKPEPVEGRIVFDQTHFTYPTRPDVVALHDISFSVDPGEIVALVGPSGAGKSTIANLIPRFYDPQSGVIRLDGHPLVSLDPSWLRKKIAVVPQEPVLFSTTIAENIGYGVDGATQEDIENAAKIANAHEFIVNFPSGYQTEVGERGVRLSGGQKQRIAIARAVIKDPRILILDEATSALDAESEFLVKQALDRIMEGRTTLIIAHRLSTVRDAHRVIVIVDGRIVEIGPHDLLMANQEGIYRKLIERQFLIHENPITTSA